VYPWQLTDSIYRNPTIVSLKGQEKHTCREDEPTFEVIYLIHSMERVTLPFSLKLEAVDDYWLLLLDGPQMQAVIRRGGD